jgi:lipopolysaccharide/colanic/teichoic acid biosynthesis glycosyltransferase
MSLAPALDFAIALVGLTIASPFLLLIAIAIWLQDFHSPFYLAPRMARGSGTFRMLKFRSMIVNADKCGVNSTPGDDPRITRVGRLVRAYKIDEIVQLWNVVKGEMSLVGPRPQVRSEARLFTAQERRLLTVRPGITDLASIVFSDESEILWGSDDPDLLYNQVIRPWKSRLALLHIERRTPGSNFRIIWLTLVGLVSRRAALAGVQKILRSWGADELLCRVARRDQPPFPYPPPGATDSVTLAQPTACQPR